MDFSDLFLLPGNAGCASAVRLTDHLPSTRPVHDPGNRFNDAVVSARQFVAYLMLPGSAPLESAAPLGFWGLLRSFAAFVAAQREPAKTTSSGAQHVDGK